MRARGYDAILPYFTAFIDYCERADSDAFRKFGLW